MKVENMKHSLWLILFFAIVSASSSVARACSCVIEEVPESLKQANAVFIGEVTDIAEPKTWVGIINRGYYL